MKLLVIVEIDVPRSETPELDMDQAIEEGVIAIRKAFPKGKKIHLAIREKADEVLKVINPDYVPFPGDKL